MQTLEDFDKMMKEIEPFLRKPENLDRVWNEWIISSQRLSVNTLNYNNRV